MIYEMNHVLNCGYEIKWSYDLRSYERIFSTCVEKPGVWTSDTALPVRLQPLTYQATDIGNWSFVDWYVPVMNELTSNEMINEMYHILNCGYEIKCSHNFQQYADAVNMQVGGRVFAASYLHALYRKCKLKPANVFLKFLLWWSSVDIKLNTFSRKRKRRFSKNISFHETQRQLKITGAVISVGLFVFRSSLKLREITLSPGIIGAKTIIKE